MSEKNADEQFNELFEKFTNLADNTEEIKEFAWMLQGKYNATLLKDETGFMSMISESGVAGIYDLNQYINDMTNITSANDFQKELANDLIRFAKLVNEFYGMNG